VNFLFNYWEKWTWVPIQTIGDDCKHLDIFVDSLEPHRDVMLGGQMWWDDSMNMFVSDEHSGHFQGWTPLMQADFILSMVASGFTVLHIPFHMNSRLDSPEDFKAAQRQQDNLVRQRGNSILNPTLCKAIFPATSSPPQNETRMKPGCTKCLRMAVTFA